MAGLNTVPAIHVLDLCAKKAWMPGTSSAKTRFALLPGHDGCLRRRVRKAIRLELVAQCGFQDLAGGGMGNAFDEGDVVGHPPFGDLAIHVFEDVLAAR